MSSVPSAEIPKLCIVTSQKLHRHTMAGNFEEVLAYSIVSKLSLIETVNAKNLVSTWDKTLLPAQKSEKGLLDELTKLAQVTHTQWVVHLSVLPVDSKTSRVLESDSMRDTPVAALKVAVQLYQRAGRKIVADLSYNFVNQVGTDLQLIRPDLNIAMDGFNSVLGNIIRELSLVLFPHLSFEAICDLAGEPLAQSYSALNYLVQALKKPSDIERRAFYEAALQADPTIEQVYAQLGKQDRLQRDFQSSVQHYKAALENSRASAHTRATYATEAGIGCALLGKHDLALQWWHRALQYDAGYINPYFNVANLYEDQNALEQAVSFFQKAQQVAPDDFRTYYNLARVYSKLNRWDQAIEQYKRQLSSGEDDPWCHSDIATCYLNKGDQHNAAFHLKRVLDLDPQGEAGEQAKMILDCLSPVG